MWGHILKKIIKKKISRVLNTLRDIFLKVFETTRGGDAK
jgi:hypothetical protein